MTQPEYATPKPAALAADPTRSCDQCGAPIEATRHPRTRFCSKRCHDQHHDRSPAKHDYERSPERRRADRDRKRAKAEATRNPTLRTMPNDIPALAEDQQS